MLSIGAGNHHSIIVIKTAEKNIVLAFGENTNNKLGVKTNKEKVAIPVEIEFFSEKMATSVVVGSNHSFIMTENMKIPKNRDLHKVRCDGCKNGQIEGVRILKSLDKNFCFACYNRISDKPLVSIAIRENMTAIKDFIWPDLAEVERSLGKEDTGKYIYNYISTPKKINNKKKINNFI